MSQTSFDIEALAAYLAKHLPGDNGEITLERIGQGHSNLTYLLTRGTEKMVLRRPPDGMLLPSTHDMVREYTFLSALYSSLVPVPKPIVLCEDKAVIGVVFYVMEHLPGVVIRGNLPPAFDTPIARAEIAEATIQMLATIHTLDYEAVGLGKIGKPQGYLERNVKRRMEQLQQAITHTRPLPVMEQVGQWLSEHIPHTPISAIVHGDFRIDNMIFAPEPPARPLGVLDWETATLGDPLVDLGYLTAFWGEPGDPPMPINLETTHLTMLEGFPSRAALIERYSELTGRNVASLAFYQAFSIWKLAISLEGSYARYLAGQADDAFFARLKESVPAMAERAWEICNKA